jgi:hypothetical protein
MHEPVLMRWSMKTERGAVQLAAGELSVDKIATKLKISPQAVIKIGLRMGIDFSPLSRRCAMPPTIQKLPKAQQQLPAIAQAQLAHQKSASK